MSVSPCFKKNVSGQHSFQECITEFPGGLAGVLQEYQETIKKIEKQVMYWKKIFPKYISAEAASWSLHRHNIVNKLQCALSPGQI